MKRFFSLIGKILGGLVKFLQAAILLVFIVIWVVALSGKQVEVPESGALIIAPAGVLVEQFEGDAVDRAFAAWQGVEQTQTLVKNVTDSLEMAAYDERVKAVVLDLEGLAGGGLSKLQVIGDAIDTFRETGKPVIAMSDGYTQAQYYLASRADEIYMHDMGMVFIDGYGYYRAFLKGAIDKLSLDINVFRVGEYKSFVEPYLRNDMSDEDRSAARQWLEALWVAYQRDVEQARGLPEGALNDYANTAVAGLTAAGGDTAVLAMNAGLVDEFMTHQQFENYLAEIVGASDEVSGYYEGIHYRDYLAAVGRPEDGWESDYNVAVLVASGTIVDGEASPGTIGGHSLAALIREATFDDSIDAVVLQVDSPGGSMFASEVVYDQIEVLRATGKPLVVSMSSVAASGGYYIAMPANEIWASPTTISGSIGVGAIVPTFQRTLGELGVAVDGFGTTALSGQLDPTIGLGADAKELFTLSVNQAYKTFVAKVAEARGMEFNRADDLARGRVWIGTDAQELGLIDQLGTLDDAIASAASLAGIEDSYGVRYLDMELTPAEQFLMQLAGGSATIMNWLDIKMPQQSALSEAMALVESAVAGYKALNDPRGLYMNCECAVP